MKKNYNHISPVSQLDETSCWAASLKFWYKAVFSITKSQRSLIDKYNHLTEADGSMGEGGLIEIMADNKMYPTLAEPSTLFDANEVRSVLSQWGPIYVAYKSSRWRYKHVVVIHGIDDAQHNPRVHVMDPGNRVNVVDPTKPLDKDKAPYHGDHVFKTLTEYNWSQKVIYGMK